ncbi:MAG: hypothetical protein ACYTF1_10725 [Planctomycetota bacterium]|jgi:acetylornithine deacetylase/succinyl-diaminopimelate desuccinylase-like protein
MSSLDSSVVDYVREASSSDGYAAYLRNTLLELVAFDTVSTGSPGPGEGRLFDWLEREIRDLLGAGVVIERAAIDPAIVRDGNFTLSGRGSVDGLEEVYAQRCNLLVRVPGGDAGVGVGVILHANVDDDLPWIGSRSAGERVYGRGASGSKAQIALLLGQMKLLREVEEKIGRRAVGGRLYQFVIDSPMNGNGSLSLGLDDRYAGIGVLMHKATNLVPCCGQAGGLWYRCRLSAGNNANTSAVELFPFVVEELEAECRDLQSQTDHPHFSTDQVRINHGLLGCLGYRLDTVCDRVTIEIEVLPKASAERVGMKIIEFLDQSVADYVEVYGDKTGEKDPATYEVMLAKHFELKISPTADLQKFRIDIYGCPGHMSAGFRCDNAIIKASYLLGGLIRISSNFPGIGARVRLADDGGDDGELVLEGVQSFSPVHGVDEVKGRMLSAARRGIQHYCRVRGREYDDGMAEMIFEGRQDDACAGSTDNVAVGALGRAFGALGEPMPEPVAYGVGCEVSIYQRKGYPVAVFGAGKPENAAGKDEFIDVPELQKALAVSTLATWSMIQ